MMLLSMLGGDDVAGAESITLDQWASLGAVSIYGIEVADICIVLTFRPRVWAGATPKTLLGAQATGKVGSLQPITRPRCGQNARRIMLKFFSPDDLQNWSGERNGDANGEVTLSDTRHLFPAVEGSKVLREPATHFLRMKCKKWAEQENNSPKRERANWIAVAIF